VLAHKSRTKIPPKHQNYWEICPLTHTRFEVKRSVKVIGSINAETESVSPTNFKLGSRLEHALSTAMASYKGLQSYIIAGGRENTVSAAPDGHKLVIDVLNRQLAGHILPTLVYV